MIDVGRHEVALNHSIHTFSSDNPISRTSCAKVQRSDIVLRGSAWIFPGDSDAILAESIMDEN